MLFGVALAELPALQGGGAVRLLQERGLRQLLHLFQLLFRCGLFFVLCYVMLCYVGTATPLQVCCVVCTVTGTQPRQLTHPVQLLL
jgi:hypothetical protein